MDYNEIYINTLHLNNSNYNEYPIVNTNMIHIDNDFNIYVESMLGSVCNNTNINKSYFMNSEMKPDNFIEFLIMKTCIDNLIKLGIKDISEFTIEYIFRNKIDENDDDITYINQMICSNDRNDNFGYVQTPIISTFLFIDKCNNPCVVVDISEEYNKSKSISAAAVFVPNSLYAVTFFAGVHMHNLSNKNIHGKYIEIKYWYKRVINTPYERLSGMNNNNDMEKIQKMVFLQIPRFTEFIIKNNITNNFFDTISEYHSYANKDLYEISTSFDIKLPFNGVIIKKQSADSNKLHDYKLYFSPN